MDVARHLADAEAFARARNIDHLDAVRRLTRALLLDELARYRRRDLFPKNRDFEEPRPYFIDADGTRCAMAHLMEMGGAGALIAEVARTSNNAYVAELAANDAFLAWLEAAGLSVEEAARIQPSYCAEAAGCICELAPPERDGGWPPRDLIIWEGTVGVDAGDLVARVDAVYTGDARVVGQQRAVHSTVPLTGGDRILVRFDEAIVKLVPNDMLGRQCLYVENGLAAPTLPELTKADALDIVADAYQDCMKLLEARDPAWAAKNCENDNPVPAEDASHGGVDAGVGASPLPLDATGNGCSTAATSHGSVAVLMAVLGVLAARRAARRARA